MANILYYTHVADGYVQFLYTPVLCYLSGIVNYYCIGNSLLVQGNFKYHLNTLLCQSLATTKTK